MRHHVIRHAFFVIALVGLLLTLDAAMSASLNTSSVSLLLLGGLLLAGVLVRLSSWVLRGSLRVRILATLGINALGLVPAVLMLPVVLSWPDAAASRVGTRIVIFWLLSIVAWTTSVLASVAPIRTGRAPLATKAARNPAGRRARLLSRV